MGGLGAVLAITPPQFGASDSMSIASGAAGIGATASASSSQPPPQIAPSEKAKAAKPAAATKNSVAQSQQKVQATVTTDPATAEPVAVAQSKATSGTFTGPSVFVKYGNVQVKITVEQGKITDVVAAVAPTGKNDRWTNMAVPILKQQTLAAQSANIQGASGASYTSYGWFTSLQGALAEAGL